jgi:N-acetyl-anhydromuramyl-L-alanine amidase AmpD
MISKTLIALALLAVIASCKANFTPRAATPPTQADSPWRYGVGLVLSQSDLAPLSPDVIDKCLEAMRMPVEEVVLADSTNFGLRETRDYLGRSLLSSPKLIVIHETVMAENDTVKLFRTPHPRDVDQVSYHMLVARDGRLVRIVPDEKRAYGAGMSHFMGATIRAKKNSAGSINNIALHVSLVSPRGYSDSDAHSGYTQAQYAALARQILTWQMRYGIPMSRVTTHYAVDRSHSRYDPRSFHWDKFDLVHRQYAQICKADQFIQPE